MAMGVCVQCGEPVGNTAKPCPNCGLAEPVPARPVLLCTTCKGIVEQRHTSCPHCGAPDLFAPATAQVRLGRCGKCAQAISLKSTQCVRCKTPRQIDADDECPRCGRPKAIGSRTCDRCEDQTAAGAARPTVASGKHRCPTCGMELSHAGVCCLNCQPLPIPAVAPVVDSLRVADEKPNPVYAADDLLSLLVGKAQPPPVAAAAAPTAQNLSLNIRCVVCGNQIPRGVRPCPMCGSPEPTDLKAHMAAVTAVPPESLKGGRHIVTILITTICVLAVAVLLLVSRTASDSSRHDRVRESLGDGATEEAILRMEQEAAELEVSTDTMIKVRFACLLRETKRPAMTELRTLRDRAAAQGHSPDEAVLMAARAACR